MDRDEFRSIIGELASIKRYSKQLYDNTDYIYSKLQDIDKTNREIHVFLVHEIYTEIRGTNKYLAQIIVLLILLLIMAGVLLWKM